METETPKTPTLAAAIVPLASIIRHRRNFGRRKYGATMERRDLKVENFMIHALEEYLDAAIYMTRVLRDLILDSGVVTTRPSGGLMDDEIEECVIKAICEGRLNEQRCFAGNVMQSMMPACFTGPLTGLANLISTSSSIRTETITSIIRLAHLIGSDAMLGLEQQMQDRYGD